MTAKALRLSLGLAGFALAGRAAASEADLRPAFGATIVSTHPDGRQARLWLKADHSYSAQGRNGHRSGGTWTVKADKLCLSQQRPYPGLFSFCKAVPRVAVGRRWSDTAFNGDHVTNALVAGRAGQSER